MLKKIKKFIVNKDEYYPNIQIFSYHLLKFIHKLLIKAKLVNPPQNKQDMFNWSLYHLHYKGELKKESKNLTQSLKTGDYVFTNNKLIKKNSNTKPLHTNHRFLYETILQLNPSSVFEMGCGTGMHLNNIQVLAPQIALSGIDLSDKQIKKIYEYYPDLKAQITQADATTPFPLDLLPPTDLTFTQAVIMHIHTDKAHIKALENLFKMAKKYVILMESAKNHPFKDDIQKLFNEGKIKWDQIFFYYRTNEEVNLPMGIICSSVPLNYPELTDYNIYFK